MEGAGSQVAGLLPLMTCCTELTRTPLSTSRLPAKKSLTSKLPLLCLPKSCFLTKQAGAQAGQEEGGRGAAHGLLPSEAFFSKQQQCKDSEDQRCQ